MSNQTLPFEIRVEAYENECLKCVITYRCRYKELTEGDVNAVFLLTTLPTMVALSFPEFVFTFCSKSENGMFEGVFTLVAPATNVNAEKATVIAKGLSVKLAEFASTVQTRQSDECVYELFAGLHAFINDGSPNVGAGREVN